MCLNFVISFALPSVVIAAYVGVRAAIHRHTLGYGLETFLRCLKFRNHFYNYYLNFGIFVAPQDEFSIQFRREEGPAILINTFSSVLSSGFTYLALTSDERYAIPAVLSISPYFSDRYFKRVEQLVGRYICDRDASLTIITPPFR